MSQYLIYIDANLYGSRISEDFETELSDTSLFEIWFDFKEGEITIKMVFLKGSFPMPDNTHPIFLDLVSKYIESNESYKEQLWQDND
jgi:hypothetical protein